MFNISNLCKLLQIHSCEQPLPKKLCEQRSHIWPLLDLNPVLHSKKYKTYIKLQKNTFFKDAFVKAFL